MTRKQRYEAILKYFLENVPVAETELNYGSTFQLLVAVILSAQCTDKRVNLTTPAIFQRYPDAKAMSEATFEELFPLVKSISYPNNKTKHLIEMSKKLVQDFNSEVPSDIDSLTSLPGVGRKTANVIASVIYGAPVIAVDTHVFRLAHRLGLSKGSTPAAVEKDLEAAVAEEYRPRFHHWILLHGRYICTARSPKCSDCGLKNICPSAETI